ncbi:MAG TPA: translational GTPase TypA [Candidatus Sphingobacterium stercoripullorum]|uniref:Large ribosomal subunit assembly factor BipA n=1 Tax=Candidatus Sphingobacterium stercoripullorum TaxID=2838759 RepID=A0A9D1W892_9SPHI|nr:translational GTPase TypA [Candidatus Sphingobacterium stercoripullorum]HLR50163.1 translational GTPase TypA [Candidatus Sphingobacterium stercoripullorum]
MQNIRNIAIIAHVDHGKTTLVDKILHFTTQIKDEPEEGNLILDNIDLERERGITIVSKNVAVKYNGTKINVIDTPGHADFGGEVERVLKMADGVILLVDAFEGPMPQTRFVTQKALSLGLKPIVVVNKVDKENCRPDEVYEQVFDLFFSLDATEEQLDFPVLYGSSKLGWMSTDWKKPAEDFSPLLDAIIKYIPAPAVTEGTLQMQVTSLDYSSFVGRIAIGRVSRGTIKENQPVSLVKADGKIEKGRVKELHLFEGVGRKKVSEVSAGDICAVVGLDGFDIGDTIADFEKPEQMDVIHIDEPTMNMLFTINNSPFFGKEGKFVTSRHLFERLEKELEKNLALRVEPTNSADAWLVYGRGILHLSVLIETMRREGYELQVGQPQVIIKEVDGVKMEPVEVLVVDVPEVMSGKVIELVTQRKGEMLIMESKGAMQHLEFDIPARGIIGLRNRLMTLTAGEAVIAHRFKGYEPWKGTIPKRQNGVLVSLDTGTATPYSIDKLQDRGTFFIDPGADIYEGQILGEHIRDNDLPINVTKGKQLNNIRAAGSDDGLRIAPALKMSLEQFMEYIQGDEYIEVTPENIRLRKILLKESDRRVAAKKTGA